jgi:tetratricopeptide (TPR) repeat protein
MPGLCSGSKVSRDRLRLLQPCVLALLFAIGACGGDAAQERDAELQRLLDEGQFEEVEARVQLYREGGESGPVLDRAEGLALLQRNADKLAEPLLEKAVAADSSLAPGIASTLAELARDDLSEGWRDRATQRMRDAYLFDPSVNLGDLGDPVGDRFYRYEKRYDLAIDIYRGLSRREGARPDKMREWLWRYGHCLENLGFSGAAMDVYQEFRLRWPEDKKYGRYVHWRLMTLLQEQAEEAWRAREPDRALDLVQQSFIGDWHMDLQQQGRYLAGQIEEGRGDLQRAKEWYEMIVADGSRFGGKVLENAKARLDELRRQGVH